MKRAAFTIFGVPTACALLAWSAATAQTQKSEPKVRQYAFACVPDECSAEVRKANEAGYMVTVSSDCLTVGAKVVCVVSGGSEDEGEPGR